jgi:hypothetical protein
MDASFRPIQGSPPFFPGFALNREKRTIRSRSRNESRIAPRILQILLPQTAPLFGHSNQRKTDEPNNFLAAAIKPFQFSSL